MIEKPKEDPITEAMAALKRAVQLVVKEARQAYEFSPGSYTNGAYQAALAVADKFMRIEGLTEATEHPDGQAVQP